ncbi:hypothetical protein, partial [Cupriavidus sp.]|uniref:hypothetical protein n=1 Tax=Cupriavidus sp. TaxID=1873897 RepID=UPI003D123E7B
FCLLFWQDKKVGRPPQGGETAFDFKPLTLKLSSRSCRVIHQQPHHQIPKKKQTPPKAPP